MVDLSPYSPQSGCSPQGPGDLDKATAFGTSETGSHYVDQAGQELTEIVLPLPSECWG